ncbi:MAG: hypothetical protein KAS13_04235, partial [Candidatus Omnitrophica bacterium]|nr:hypothetical protein [Candidatus Omnitrophota bacterium]
YSWDNKYCRGNPYINPILNEKWYNNQKKYPITGGHPCYNINRINAKIIKQPASSAFYGFFKNLIFSP